MSAALIHRLKLRPTSLERDAGLTLCGRFRPRHVSELASDVTCSACKHALPRRAEAVAAHTTDLIATPLRRGTHKIDARIARIIERSRLGEDESRRRWTWPNAVLALATLECFRQDGQPLRSSSRWHDPKERVQTARTDASDQVTALVDRLVHVQQALDAAFTVARVYEASVDEEGNERPRASLTPEMQRLMLMRSVAGAAGFQGLAHAQVAEWCETRWCVDLTEKQVAIVRNDGLRSVSARLRQLGELEPSEEDRHVTRRAEGARVALPGMDVEGWGEISGVIGLSVSTCQKLADRDDDPLPRYTFRGVAGVWAKRAELEEWCKRQISRAS